MPSKPIAKKVPAKKVEAPAPAAEPHPSGLAGPVKQGPEVYFARPDLARLEIAQLRATSAKQLAELQQARIDAFQAEAAAKLAGAREELKKLAAEYQKQADAVALLYRQIGEVYSLDMERTSYDPHTGRIAAH
jgi:hypothetical protein